MRLIHTGKNFIADCSFEERHIPKAAGFRWHAEAKKWYTPKIKTAVKLIEYADTPTREKISQTCLFLKPFDRPLLPSPCDEPFYDFQLRAIKFALWRNHSYLGLDPGLGKTICAAGIMNNLSTDAVYICPPFLMENVKVKMQKWRVTGTAPLIYPDSQLQKVNTIMDMVRTRFRKASKFPLLFVDEAHRFKNDSANRTRLLFTRIAPHFEKIVCLSGSPMPNGRPMELYPHLAGLAHDLIDFMPKFEYGIKYCAGYKSEWGWDFTGASNLGDFATRVKDVFLHRVLKKDVLKELPPKIEELVFIDDSGLPPEIKAYEQRMVNQYGGDPDVMKEYIGEPHVSTYRHELGVHKAPFACTFLTDLLNDTDENILVFAIHKTVIEELREGLRIFNPLVITGDTPTKNRQPICDDFQKNPERRVLIGNIQAMGVGFDLTKASRVVFVEFDWVPDNNTQASDRAHRIGQTETVLVQYLCFTNSIDRKVLESNMRKIRINRKF